MAARHVKEPHRDRPPWAALFEERMEKLTEALGIRPDLDALPNLYRPEVPHEAIPQDDAFQTHRIRVDGVVVRYNEDFVTVTLTVEGELPQSVLNGLLDDLRTRLSMTENAQWVVRPL